MENLSQEELNERIAVLRRFRTLLEQQRAKFAEYLNVLECQEAKISQEDTQSLMNHTELEGQIVSSISSLQKVIIPIRTMYEKERSFYSPEDAVPVETIQKELDSLQQKVIAQNERNRNLLKSHLSQIRQQIDSFKNPYRNAASVYARNSASAGTRIAIEV
ncbi:flagellar export chaperone FlgN [Treponema sp.]|uniref:flagellar export chaperone FlgN n=1 Tax=Treponema sp. TaxID=166 RepID=UPI0025FD02BD|nr:flagellar export chaperone FlgN [Treponema sp.]MCR5219335.1 flagellar biosynthesis protein FlgN [Treponema sp.]